MQDRITALQGRGDMLRCLSPWSAVPTVRACGRSSVSASEEAARIALKRAHVSRTFPAPTWTPDLHQTQAKRDTQEFAAGCRMRTRQYISLAVRDRWQDRQDSSSSRLIGHIGSASARPPHCAARTTATARRESHGARVSSGPGSPTPSSPSAPASTYAQP